MRFYELKSFVEIQWVRLHGKNMNILAEIMFISVCTIVRGADHWHAIKLFTKTKERWDSI